jgi:hypothetical protein
MHQVHLTVVSYLCQFWEKGKQFLDQRRSDRLVKLNLADPRRHCLGQISHRRDLNTELLSRSPWRKNSLLSFSVI